MPLYLLISYTCNETHEEEKKSKLQQNEINTQFAYFVVNRQDGELRSHFTQTQVILSDHNKQIKIYVKFEDYNMRGRYPQSTH